MVSLATRKHTPPRAHLDGELLACGAVSGRVHLRQASTGDGVGAEGLPQLLRVRPCQAHTQPLRQSPRLAANQQQGAHPPAEKVYLGGALTRAEG